jgi:hypothetical protein
MKVSAAFAVISVLAASAVSFTVVDKAATKATEAPNVVWTHQQCFSCHTDSVSLAEVRDKRADPHWLELEYNEFHKNDACPAYPQASVALKDSRKKVLAGNGNVHSYKQCDLSEAAPRSVR